jgi:hypothetical protein
MDFVRQMQASEYGTLEVVQVRATGVAAGATNNLTYTPPKNYWIVWLEMRQGDMKYDKFTMTMVLDNIQYPTFYMGMEMDYPFPLYVTKPCKDSTTFSFTNIDAGVQDLAATMIGLLIPFAKLEDWKNRFGEASWLGDVDIRNKQLEATQRIAGAVEKPKEVVTE